jgi:hypothetical protein
MVMSLSTRVIVFFPLLVWYFEGVVFCFTASSNVPARLLVLDTLVPGQRLRLEGDIAPASFRELCETSQDPLIVVGRQGLSLHSRGIQVFVEEDSSGGDTFTLSAATGRIAAICHGGEDEGSRWAGRQGTVKFLACLHDDDLALSPKDCIPEENTIAPDQMASASESLRELFLEWEHLVRNSGRERFPGHLDGIRIDLGEMPENPNARALWIAGFINPLPALGVALEIRPSVLTARSTERRLIMADKGLRDSISRLQRPGPCF